MEFRNSIYKYNIITNIIFIYFVSKYLEKYLKISILY